jgi:hypothetical protein
MYNKRAGRGITRAICILLAVSLLVGFGLCCGEGETTYSSTNLYANWGNINDKSLGNEISQENSILEKLLQEKNLLDKTVQDKNLDNPTLQEKLLQQKMLDDKISQEKVKQDNLLQEKSLQESVYSVKISNSGSSVSGLKVKFPKKLTSSPGFDYLTYSVSPYHITVFAEQKLASAKTFAEPQDQSTTKTLLKACIERLGTHLCTQGNKVAF